MYLHVQVSNDAAKQFYQQRGFEEIEVIKDYYKKIDPADCFHLKKILRPELVAASTVSADAKNRSITSVDAEN